MSGMQNRMRLVCRLLMVRATDEGVKPISSAAFRMMARVFSLQYPVLLKARETVEGEKPVILEI